MSWYIIFIAFGSSLGPLCGGYLIECMYRTLNLVYEDISTSVYRKLKLSRQGLGMGKVAKCHPLRCQLAVDILIRSRNKIQKIHQYR